MSMSRIDDYETWYEDQDSYGDPLNMDTILVDSKIEQRIFDNSIELLSDLGAQSTFGELAAKALNREYHVIESNVGDDANITTDLEIYGLLSLCTAVHVSFIKLSMKDIGISKLIANYAEGWMLTPPSAGSSFEAVNRFNKGRGLAFVMDPVKLKLLSAVRKQSSEEMDLESKLTHLAEIAAWTDRSWFTYDFHQMSLILANCVFDFNDAHTFPFLYKTEGGCGGMPPYGNLATAYSALHYYTRGRSKRAIVGVMQESLNILFSEMSPKDTYFLRASHLANAGDGQWAHYESAYRTMIKHGEISRTEARDVLKELTGSQLDPSVLQMGFEVTPEVYTVGSAIGHLRSKGYLMTEIDVKLLSQKVEKERAVFGKTPIGDILRTQEENARMFKSQAWKLLTTLYSGSKTVRAEVDGRLGMIDNSYEAFTGIAEQYYRMRGDHNAQFSSFFYTDAIRVFKTKDIQQYFGKFQNQLMEDFGLTSFLPKVRSEPEENRFELEARRAIEDWLDSGHLSEILEGPLPTGIGNDDARILRDLDLLTANPRCSGFVAVILSDDSGLIRAASTILKRKAWGKHTTACVCQLRRNDYTAICLQGVRERFDLKLQNREKPPRIHQVPYYNYIMKQMWMLPETSVMAIRDMIPGTWRKAVECCLYYDVPNLERGLERTTYRPDTNTVVMFGGGCLDRRTVDSLPYGQSWAELPLSRIKEWEDFSSQKRRTLYAKDIKIRPAQYVARPERIVSTRTIQFWLNSAVRPDPVPVV